MIIKGKIITPSNPEDYLVKYSRKIVAKYVHLGRNSSPEDWTEVDHETGERLKEEWKDE